MTKKSLARILKDDQHDILKTVQAVREGIMPHRHAPSGVGRHMFRIPEQHFYALLRLFPNLNALDPELKQKAWEAFEMSPFSEAYRIGRLHRGVIKDGLIGEAK